MAETPKPKMCCITAGAPGLEGPFEARFARAPYFIFVEDESGAVHSVANALCTGSGGVGPRAVQFVVEYGATIVITGRMGENAVRALEAAGIPAYAAPEETKTVGDALEAFRAGTLKALS